MSKRQYGGSSPASPSSGMTARFITSSEQRSGRPNTCASTVPPGLVTRHASLSARVMSSAKKSELKPVTTSNLSSPNGRSCMSPM